MDIQIPMRVELRMLCEGRNRDGTIRKEDLEESLNAWKGLPIIDFHDMTDMANPTAHKISDRKGYVGENLTVKVVDGKEWIVGDGYITDRYLAYLIYLANLRGKPYEISPEFRATPYYMSGVKYQTNIRPHLITVVDRGHLEGNKLAIQT
jgi:hypothetical protein